MTLHFAYDPLTSPSLPSALASEPGAYSVRISCSRTALQKRLRLMRAWLLDLQLPHRLEIVPRASSPEIAVSFPEAAYAHAFQIQFGGRLEGNLS